MSDIDLIRRIIRLEGIIDNLVKPEVPRWITWTPTVTQSVAITVTVNYAKYMLDGNLMVVHADLSVTSAGTSGNAIIVSGIPNGAARASDFTIGHGVIVDSGTQLYVVEVIANTATGWRFFEDAAGGNYVGITPNFALASGDTIKFTATYERA